MKKQMKRCILGLVIVMILAPLAAWSVAAQKALPNAASIAVVPHRAIYKMSLASVKNGTSIANVAGKMLFDWSDTCDGWAIQQHLNLHFQYAEGDDTDVNSSVLTWESKDGKKFRFQVRRVSNGKETENFKGSGVLSDKGGLAKYVTPKDKKDIVLPPGTLFPTSHTVQILREALAGKQMFTRRVFDGSDDEGAADVSAFIGTRKDMPKDEDFVDTVKRGPLVNVPAWPVRLSFYKPDSESSLPDYEMDMVLQANGIARSLLIDYGDFAVSGVLIGLEPQAAVSCSLP